MATLVFVVHVFCSLSAGRGTQSLDRAKFYPESRPWSPTLLLSSVERPQRLRPNTGSWPCVHVWKEQPGTQPHALVPGGGEGAAGTGLSLERPCPLAA